MKVWNNCYVNRPSNYSPLNLWLPPKYFWLCTEIKCIEITEKLPGWQKLCDLICSFSKRSLFDNTVAAVVPSLSNVQMSKPELLFCVLWTYEAFLLKSPSKSLKRTHMFENSTNILVITIFSSILNWLLNFKISREEMNRS